MNRLWDFCIDLQDHLACPIEGCGLDYMHITDIARNGNLTFTGECGHRFQLTFLSHEGMLSMDFNRLPDDAGPDMPESYENRDDDSDATRAANSQSLVKAKPPVKRPRTPKTPPLTPGLYRAVMHSVKRLSRLVQITFCLTDVPDDKFHYVMLNFTASLDERSKLRKCVEALVGRTLVGRESVDFLDLIGSSCDIDVHEDAKGRQKFSVSKMRPFKVVESKQTQEASVNG